jgi:hypothetical protein
MGVAITEELERSAVKPEVAELIDKAAQGILLRGGSMTQCLRKKPDLKGFGGSPKLHLRLHPLFIAPVRIAVQFRGTAGNSGQGEEEMRTSNRRLVPALAALVFAWAMIPSALAQCGIPTKLAKPAAWHPQMGGAHPANGWR